MTAFRVTALPRATSAVAVSLCPSFTEIRVEAPTPIMEPKAAEMFISGKVSESPAMAMAFTPRPMNITSAMLYMLQRSWK